MASDKHMIESLSDMLREDESLLYPVFGYIKDNGFHQFAYFGFTENYLLIAYLSGEHFTGTERIPLEIASVKINKSPILNEYTINILFINSKSYIISVPPKVLKIKAQKENFPLFLEALKRRAKNQAKSLEEVEGKRIRWQYFNTYIYMVLSFIPTVPIMIIISELRKGNVDIWNVIVEMAEATPALLVMYGLLIGPFAILSILNRFFFGKILGVVNEKALFLENREISIRDIKKIIYHPRFMSRRSLRFSSATIFLHTKANHAETLDIVHFPMYGLREIKKYNKEIKLNCDEYIWFLLLCPSVVSAIISFLLSL